MLFRLRKLSWCVTVVVVSDDPAFLATVAKRSFRHPLLAWPTRLLGVTRLPLMALHDLHRTFAQRNAMMITVDSTPASPRCSVYIHVPYSLPGSRPLMVATWTPKRGLTLTTHLQLFPDKFNKFLQRPSLVVTSEQFASHRLVMVDDPMAPGGKRVTFVGTMEKFINYLSTALNFTYTYVRPPDGGWGNKQGDGSFSGMVGVVSREEADIGLGPFSISAPRAEVVDFTYPITLHYLKLLAALGDHEVDPWGFLLPLAPLVWLGHLDGAAGGAHHDVPVAFSHLSQTSFSNHDYIQRFQHSSYIATTRYHCGRKVAVEAAGVGGVDDDDVGVNTELRRQPHVPPGRKTHPSTLPEPPGSIA
ncbi:glutamate receptor-like [Panulirus ornatus]|uniref:glutamate receptor-like n=1 Tax=Panulirus ornatus TaxID=150431 RepID=UPI003A8524F3